MKKTLIIIAPVLIIAALFLNACSETEGTKLKAEEIESFTYVEAKEVRFDPFVEYISLVGIARANQEAQIASAEGGKIEKYLKNKGDYISEGETILEIENEVLKATLDQAKAQYEMADMNFRKQEEIYNQKVTSELQFLNSKYERDAAKANYELIKSRYEKTFVKAPFSGIFDHKYVETGEFAMPGTPIVSMVSINKIKIEAGVPENYVGEIKTGGNVKVIFNDLGGAEYDAKISYVGNTINYDNRTFPIEIIITNNGKNIKPQLNAEVKIERARHENVAVIPEDIITRTNEGYVVFVEENGIAKMKEVDIVSRFNNLAAVREGISEGDNLVHVGYQNLVDGEKVRILE
jgi:membrane fusion protein, multidrug efflux system